MKRFLLAFVCLLGLFLSSTNYGIDLAEEDKPDITNPISVDHSI